MQVISGRKISQQLELKLTQEIQNLNFEPCLAMVLAGENPASMLYVKRKQQACQRLGIRSVVCKLKAEVTEKELGQQIEELNQNSKIHGILCQSPLPKAHNPLNAFAKIVAEKDVDGLNPANLGLLVTGEMRFIPCTALGILYLLKQQNFCAQGKKIVIVGRSLLVGRPLSILLSSKKYNATVTLCHSETKNLKTICQTADLLIVAIGQAKKIDSDYLKPGVIIIDVGINHSPASNPENRLAPENQLAPENRLAPKNQLTGDVDFEQVKHLAAAITPVPGGVGPLTVSMVAFNTVHAARLQQGLAGLDVLSF